MKQYNVMLKPASSLCNLRCRYCFYCDVADLREVRSFGIMTDETMRMFCGAWNEAFRREIRLRSSLRAASRCWQGWIFPALCSPDGRLGPRHFGFLRAADERHAVRPRLVRVFERAPRSGGAVV